MTATRLFLRDSQTHALAGENTYDMSETQGTPATLDSDIANNFGGGLIWVFTVDDTPDSDQWPTSLSFAQFQNYEVRWRLERLNSAGVLQDSSANSPTISTDNAGGPGVHTHTFTFDTAWQAGDVLALNLETNRLAGATLGSLNVNHEDTWVDATLAEAAGGPVPLAGTSTSASEASGDLTVVTPPVELAGTTSSASALSGSLTATRGITGTSESASDLSGSLTVGKAVSDTDSGSGSDASFIPDYAIFRRTPQTGETFDPDTDTPIDRTPNLTYTDTPGDGAYDYQVFGWDGSWTDGSTVEQVTVGDTTPISGTDSGSGDESVVLETDDEAGDSGTGADSAVVAAERSLSATSGSASTLSGALTVPDTGDPPNLTVTIIPAGEAVPLAGTSQSASALSGTLSAVRGVTGVSEAASGLSGSLAATRGVEGSSQSASELTGDLTVLGQVPLAGTSESASEASGSLTADRTLTGTSESASRLAGTLGVLGQIPLSGASQSAADLSGSLSVTRGLAGSAESASDLSGDLSAARNLTATSESASDLSGDLNVFTGIPLAATLTSASDLTGSLSMRRGLTGSSQSASDLSGLLSRTVPLSATTASATALNAALARLFTIAGSIHAATDLDGSLRIVSVGDGTVALSPTRVRIVGDSTAAVLVGTHTRATPVGTSTDVID